MARRIVLIVLGVLLLVIGALAAIGGGALMALFGSSDTLSSGVQQVSTLTRALVSPADSIQGASGAQTVVGNVRLRITATPAGAGHCERLRTAPRRCDGRRNRTAPTHRTFAAHRCGGLRVCNELGGNQGKGDS